MSIGLVINYTYKSTCEICEVISEAFGSFVIAGNFVVGIFVFAILVIINLVVITKGAGRVSEVTARFTLDSMPGKQMAIDADLNAGILTPEEATERRNEVAREADFYGSMDGAFLLRFAECVLALRRTAARLLQAYGRYSYRCQNASGILGLRQLHSSLLPFQ